MENKKNDNFKMLFDQAPLGYQSLDIDGNFIEVNQKWCDTLGYERGEVIGKWFGDFLTPAYQDGFRERFPVFKAQGHIHSEFEMVHKNGNILFIAFEGQIGYSEDGNFKQTHCILEDITEKKIAEQKFKELMTKHQTFIDTVPDIIMEVDSNKVYKWANKAGYEFFGDDVIGKEASYYFEGEQDTYDKVRPLFQGNEEIIYLESYQRRKDGKIRLLAWWCKVYKDSEGNAVGSISSARDITDTRELENSLVRNEEKLRLVIDGVLVPIVFVDSDLRYSFVNKAYADWYNTSKEDIEGKLIKDILAEDVYERALPNYRAVLSGNHVSFDNRTIRDGKEKYVSVRMLPHYNDGKIVGFFSSITDITESKLAEIELKKKNRELNETNSVMVGRELKMIELKHEVNELLKSTGKKEKYDI